MKVACVDENPVFGGTCLRVGCIPSKALLESSHLYEELKHGLDEHGIQTPSVQLDLQRMMERKNKIVKALTEGIGMLFKKNKVQGYYGRGKLRDVDGVQVEQTNGETVLLRGKHTIIATGSRPSTMRGIEEDGVNIGNSTMALSFDKVPQRLVVIGGGYIGLELSSVWSRLGSKVTILEAMDRMLPIMDQEIAKIAQRIFARQGLEVTFGAWVESAKVVGDHCVVKCKDKDPIECDKVLLSTGRSPNSDNIGLENIGLETDKRGFIPVDHNYQTAVKNLFAIGDVIGGAMLAHKGMEEG